MEELERIHRYRINNKEVKEQITAYLSRLDETEKNKDKFPNEVYVQMYQNNFLEGKPITSIEEDISLSREILLKITAKDIQDWIASWNNNSKNWVFMMQGNDPDYDFPTKRKFVNIMQAAKDVEATTATEEIKSGSLVGLRGRRRKDRENETDQDAECRGMDINERLQGVLQVLRPERHQGKPVGRKFRRDVIAPGRKSTISLGIINPSHVFRIVQT